MIYIVDVASAESQHEQFNISFVELLKLKYINDSLTFFCDPSHRSALQNRLSNIQFSDATIYKKRGGINEFIRAYLQFRHLSKIVQQAKKQNVTQMYILLLHPFAHFLFKQFHTDQLNVRIVIHGELESVKFNKHFLNKIWGFFQTRALTIVKPNVQYILLGNSIYNNLMEVMPSFSQQSCIIMDHPYPFEPRKTVLPENNPIVFSSLGVATLSKNTQYLFKIASEASELGYGEVCKFNICGRVLKNMEDHLNGHVTYKEDFKILTREESNELINESSFAVFYYENAHYSLCPSGAFWDAVNAEIPLLYVRNDYFDYYAEIAGGIGVPFEDPESLNRYILSVIKSRALGEDYYKYVDNIRKLKYELMSSEKLLHQLST
ncbi:hypothetical protein [Dyadobacter sp. CY323]|uniref:hypothetical protein n=1 Tax=Dyadobacter sp. CY323 TaxID=2907302 RepID=UPI001F260AF5|nr:hypothetical protein [Dyadobacter sp. CY323]MCE6990963.1 hypothetical protein [Dyadobacter sp. CY323]